jgi:hypothetical protein
LGLSKESSTHNEQKTINVPFTQKRAHSNPQNKYKKNKKDIEETAMTMIDWDDEDEESMPPPLMAKETYINEERNESSLESNENSLPAAEDTTTSMTTTAKMKTTTLHNEMRPRGPPMRAPVCVHPSSHVL